MICLNRAMVSNIWQHIWQWSRTYKSLAGSDFQYMHRAKRLASLYTINWKYTGNFYLTYTMLQYNLFFSSFFILHIQVIFTWNFHCLGRYSCMQWWQRRGKCSWDVETWNGGWEGDNYRLGWDRECAISKGRDGQPWEEKTSWKCSKICLKVSGGTSNATCA